MAIEAYGQNGDTQKAQERYEALGDEASEVLDYVAQNPEGLSSDLILSFSNAVAATAPPPEPEAAPRNWYLILIPILCVLGLVVVAILVWFLIIRGRQPTGGVPTPAMQAQEAKRQAAWTDYTSTGAEPPISQFMASYKLGDDLFDDSFSIDSASGEFLGECGVGISELVSSDQPKKVTAFEVWLFDKNDIQTVTKVIMSANAFNKDVIRQRLSAKGEPVLADLGAETVLETQTLQMVARIVDMGYGEDGDYQSYFERFILELAIWPK
jgi:hypothetical protein